MARASTRKTETTEVAKRAPIIRTVQTLLTEHKAHLQAALPRHLTADRMIRVVLTALTTSPKLQECSLPSIARSVIVLAQLGLEPDGVLGYAYLVPFRNKRTGRLEAQPMVGYRGYLALARRSGQLSSLDVDVIGDNDRFEYQKGSRPILIHVPALIGPRGKILGAYACARLLDGGVQFEVLPIETIENLRAHSQTADSGPWATHWEAMAKKTAIRQLAKYLPLSPEFQRQAIREEYAEAGVEVAELDLASNDLGTMIADATAASAEQLKEKYRSEGEGEQPTSEEPPEPGSAG